MTIYHVTLLINEFRYYINATMSLYCIVLMITCCHGLATHVISGQFHSSYLQGYEKLHGTYHSPSQ